MTSAAVVCSHIDEVARGLEELRAAAPLLERWARCIVDRIDAGGRILVAGNGGSAAQAVHLAAEFVGRYRAERRPLPAISLSADPAILTALVNDYGSDHVFARQIEAQARAVDVVVLLSTSGRSGNVVAAARTAREVGALTLAFTGPAPNPLATACDDALWVAGPSPAAVQEVHLVALHALCECIDELLVVRA